MRHLLLTLLVLLLHVTPTLASGGSTRLSLPVVSEREPIDSLRATPPRPRIRFKESIINIGTVSVSQITKPMKLYFEYENIGKAPLTITGADTSCGCTQPVVKKGNKVKPGKKGKLLVTFDPRGLEDRGQFGNLITVLVNGPQDYVRIRVIGNLTD